MIGLTRVLISPSVTVGGAATLLIRLCTLWFGLVLGGVAALLTFRAMQRVEVSQENVEEDDREENDNIEENKLPAATQLSGEEPELASASASSGEKVNENAHHYSNL